VCGKLCKPATMPPPSLRIKSSMPHCLPPPWCSQSRFALCKSAAGNADHPPWAPYRSSPRHRSHFKSSFTGQRLTQIRSFQDKHQYELCLPRVKWISTNRCHHKVLSPHSAGGQARRIFSRLICTYVIYGKFTTSKSA
jgi:hypothetical protein